jgi:hypothetical protein
MKKIKDLKPGEVFLDSFGLPLKVEKTTPVRWQGIPNTEPKIKVFFITDRGNRMFMNFRANKEVKIITKEGEVR